eukprot:TRINITY_DN24797_c0_g1_i1.p1 TRINITY_DN24797_c0_g1~~TRINITY_DN24797_c0_g1_i1.p1  ORF type:complete len:372 (+),score=16.62 TRINITY_DN24797_c0_g1_i1:94-1209(+)
MPWRILIRLCVVFSASLILLQMQNTWSAIQSVRQDEPARQQYNQSSQPVSSGTDMLATAQSTTPHHTTPHHTTPDHTTDLIITTTQVQLMVKESTLYPIATATTLPIPPPSLTVSPSEPLSSGKDVLATQAELAPRGKISHLITTTTSRILTKGSTLNPATYHDSHPLATTSVQCVKMDHFVDGTILTDRPSKLQVRSAPKAGATVATQIMFNFLGLTETALNYSSWIHNYRVHIFDKHKSRRNHIACNACGVDGWKCLMLVRSPFDRVVSAYIHVMSTGIQSNIQQQFASFGPNATFAEFIDILKVLGRTGVKVGGEEHYLPQAPLACGRFANSPWFMRIPTESLDAGLHLFASTTIIHGLARRGMSSSH